MMLTPEQLIEIRNVALGAEGARFELEGFEQIAGNGHFYGGLVMHENGETIVAQCVMQPWAKYIAATNPAVMLQLLYHIDAQQARIAELEKHQRRSEDDFVRFWDKHGAGNNLTAEAAARMAYGSAFPDYFTGYGDGFDLTCDEVRKRDARISELEKDAARYRWLRDHEDPESIEGPARDMARAMLIDSRKTDEAIDAAMQPTWPEDTSDYGSRIAVIGQNGNDALAYQEIKP